jgi:hypothetical protein
VPQTCSLQPASHSATHERACVHRWLGVDKIVLCENQKAINATLLARLQPFVATGFLDLGKWPGRFSQRNLGRMCAKADMLGRFSWVGALLLLLQLCLHARAVWTSCSAIVRCERSPFCPCCESDHPGPDAVHACARAEAWLRRVIQLRPARPAARTQLCASDRCTAHRCAGFPDIDEFIIMFDRGMPAEHPNLKKVLAANKYVPAFAIRWLVFGTAGHVKRPSPGGPLAHYNSCHGKMHPQSKCLANMWFAGHPMQPTIHTCGHLCAAAHLSRVSCSACASACCWRVRRCARGCRGRTLPRCTCCR